ncbi:MAG: GNAT family N-acetyltransferase [Cyanobacteria bacterium P01_D01_bin.105]
MPEATDITFSERKDIEVEQLRQLYLANDWSSGRKPTALHRALENSHTVISAWDDGTLVGVGNALSDGFLVVYYPHLLVHPDYQGQGIGKQIMDRLRQKYEKLHMQMLVSEADAIAFYEKCGFTRAGDTQAMWIYNGDDH